MSSEAENEYLSLFLPFFVGFTHFDPSQTRPDPDQIPPDPDQNPPDPDLNSSNGPDPRTQTERFMLLNPFLIGQALFHGEPEKQGRPPASKAAVESMPVVEIGEKEAGECAICLEDWRISGRIVKEMPCKHRFHGDCVEKWLGIHGSCPVCRFEMPCEKENEGNKSSGNGGERRMVLVSFRFGGRNPDRSSSTGDSDSAR